MRVKSSAFHFTTDTQAFWENTQIFLVLLKKKNIPGNLPQDRVLNNSVSQVQGQLC